MTTTSSADPGTPSAAATERVAVWHTNVVFADVPVGLSRDDALRHVMQQVDAGDVHFEAQEGGVEYVARGDVPTYWTDRG